MGPTDNSCECSSIYAIDGTDYQVLLANNVGCMSSSSNDLLDELMIVGSNHSFTLRVIQILLKRVVVPIYVVKHVIYARTFAKF